MYELGGTFDFDSATIEKRIQLGYLDTKKAFSQLLGRIYYFMPRTFRSMVIRYGADTVSQLEELAYALGVDLMHIYTAESFILATKEAFLAYRQAKEEAAKAKEAAAEETETKDKERPAIISKIKEKQESEPSFLRATLKKRFASKDPLADYPDAVALLDNYII